MKFNPLEITEQEYTVLLESGIGAKQYVDFPPNINVYRSMIAVADAQLELWKYVTHFMQYTDASPTDIVKAMLTSTVNTNFIKQAFKDGLLTMQDVYEMENELDD